MGGIPRVVSIIDKQKMFTKTIEMVMKGHSRKEIFVEYQKIHPDISEALGNKTYNDAMQLLIKEQNINIHSCIDTHTIIYEKIYREFRLYNNIVGENKAMFNKEKLLGLHKEETSITINNKTKIIQRERSYDAQRLTTSEQKRLEELIAKATKK